jgi:hypothetical protein
MKKVGIITFHNSYNCGSMLESYAMQTIVEKLGYTCEIIDFSSKGQKELYSVMNRNNSIKNIIKNIILLPHKKDIELNNSKYEEFKNKNFKLSKNYSHSVKIIDDDYFAVIAGSDQIWNITIKDYNDVYFLNWVKGAKKIAYAPSFGARKIGDYTNDIEKYNKFLKSFSALSIRENNGQKWINEMINKMVPVLLDPTLLLKKEDYDLIEDSSLTTKEKYIFFYSPSFDRGICKYIKSIAEKYKLKVITWSTKSYHVKLIKTFGFELPKYESPAIYLNMIKNAELVMTTSYHGTIFSTIFQKKFITIKNGDMYGNDDRVITLLSQLDLMDRLIPYDFDDSYDYLTSIDYSNYEKKLVELREQSINYLKNSLGDKTNEEYK